MSISANQLRVLLATLDFPPHDFVVAGSGPLLARGLKPLIDDLDLIARGKAWARALDLSGPSPAASGRGLRVGLPGGLVEIFDHWHPVCESGADIGTDRLIDEAEVVRGVRFLSLTHTVAWKRSLGREKDLADIALIETYLARTAEAQRPSN